MHAPMKSKLIRGNEKPHMNEELKKAIMIRSRLRNTYNHSKKASDLAAYRLQRNLVTKLNKKVKLMYFNKTLDTSNYSPKMFWKTCDPFMTSKASSKKEFVLKINGKLIQNETEIAKLLNEHFNTIAKSLNLFEWNSKYYSDLKNPVLRAIDKYKEHPSIMKIKSFGSMEKLSFRKISTKHVSDLIMILDCNKKTGGSISNTTLKLAIDILSPVIKDILNSTFTSDKFPPTLIIAEITPIPKNGNSQENGDFRPITILPTISKVLANQISQFFELRFSNFFVIFGDIILFNMLYLNY